MERKQADAHDGADSSDPFVVSPAATPHEQEERILRMMGLKRGPLPKVRIEWLSRYFAHLAANLSLPFEAEYAEDISGFRQLVSRVTVIALIPPDEHASAEDIGLFCRVRRGAEEIEVPLADVELEERTVNSQLIDDYWYWIWNWRFDPSI
jgi:hypothetical protein